MADLNHANHDGIAFAVVGSELRASLTRGQVTYVTAARVLANTDKDNILYVSGNFNLTLPSTLADSTVIMVIVTSGVVGIVEGVGATLEGGEFTLDATYGQASATLIHDTGGAWRALSSAPAAPKSRIVDVTTTLELTEAHDGSMVHLADGANVTVATGLSAGWACTVTRDGVNTGVITRSAGQVLYGPTGDAASYSISQRRAAVAIHAKGSEVFYVDGPVV